MASGNTELAPRRVILHTVLDMQRGRPSYLGEVIEMDGTSWKVVVISLDNMTENSDTYTLEKIA